MRFVRRPDDPPKALAAPAFRIMRDEYLKFLNFDPRRRRQTRPPDRHLPESPDLDRALRQLFHDKCAFCELRAPLSIYRFRPTANALPVGTWDDGLAYGWLADAWPNLYPICAECRPSNPNHFPVDGRRAATPTPEEYASYAVENSGRWPAFSHEPDGKLPQEMPLLLDPCVDDHRHHLVARYDSDLGASLTGDRRGDATVLHFRLNRASLIQQRAAAVARERDRLEGAGALIAQDSDADLSAILPDEIEFAGFLRLLARNLSGSGASARDTLSTRAPTSPDGATAAHALPAYSDPPRLTHVSIKGFKGIEDLHFTLPTQATPEDATPALLILGENAAGKSSILEAIALTLVPPAARKALVEDASVLLLDPVFMGSKQERRERGAVALVFQSQDGKTVRRNLRFNAAGFKGGAPPADLPVFAYGAYRHYLKDFRDWVPERGVVSLFRSDNLLSNPEKWLLSLTEPLFDEVVAALRLIFGPSGGFEFIERDEDRCMVVTRPDQGSAAETRTPLSAVSSGFRTILALSCDVMRWLTDAERGWSFPTLAQARGLVLVDEIEAHLHPRWKVQIMEGLRRALPQVTFIVTTHDPLCLRGMRPGEVVVLRRIPGAGAEDLPVRVEQLTGLPDMTRLTIEQLLKSDFFALYDTDDPSRGAALSELADALAGHPARDSSGAAAHADLLRKFRAEIEAALPVGASDVSMLVQEAVAEYIREQGQRADAERQALRDDTRRRIVAILSTGRDPGARDASR